MEAIKNKPVPEVLFHAYITEAKNKDAALSAFDRDVRNKEYEPETIEQLRKLFQPIRQERLDKRKMADIGGVAEKRTFKYKDVLYNIRLAKWSLKECARVDDVILALLFMTGRRTAEVVGDTVFNQLKFKGTVKGGKEFGEARYLCSLESIVKGIAFLKKNGFRELTAAEANKKCGVLLMRRLQNYKGVEVVHDLRKMHIAYWIYRLKRRIAVKKMSPHDRSEYIGRFVNDALGHTNPMSAIPYLNCEVK